MPALLRALLSVVLFLVPLGAQAPVQRQTRTVLVGINRDFPPYEYLNSKGEADGYDVEMIRAAAAVLGYRVQFKADRWDVVRQDLEAGRIQVLPGMLHSPERAEKVDFTQAHLKILYGIFVRREQGAPESLPELRGKSILVERGSRMHDHLLKEGFGPEIVAVDSEPEALRRLASGRESAALVPILSGQLLIREHRLGNLELVGEPTLPLDLCFAVAKGHPELRAQLDTGLAILNRTGESQRIRDRWFGGLSDHSPRQERLMQVLRYGILGSAALGLLALGWVLLLRGTVRARTGQLERANRDLAQSRAFMEALVDSLPLMVFAKDPNDAFRYVVWNREAERLLCIPRTAILGRQDAEIFPPHQALEFRAQDEAVMAGQPSQNREEEIELPDGRRLQIRTTKVPIRTPGGRATHLLGISEDLSELHRLARDLERHRDRLAEAQRIARTGSWEWSQDGLNQEEASEEFWRLLQAEPGEGQPLSVLLGRCAPEDRFRLEALIRRVAEEGKPGNLEHVVLLPRDGERVFRSEVHRMDGGKGATLLGTCQDITEQRHQEDSLRQTQKLESLGMLAGGIAHDFNNLLTAVLGNLALVEAQVQRGDSNPQPIRNMEQTLLRAADLAKQMLAYSGRGVFVLGSVDLNALAGEMLGFLRASLSKKIRLELHPAEALPPVSGDPTQLRQVLLNLLTNAAEAIGDREGQVRLETRRIDLDAEAITRRFPGQELLPGPHVELQVEDDGCGMDEATRARIFDPFFTTKFPGRGLGLSVLHGILRAHHTGIELESEPGRGSRFRLCFPCIPGAESDPPTNPGLPPPPAQTGTGALLLVEDEPMVREVTAELLATLGYRVIQAADGLEALEAYEAHRDELRLILMDLTMPRLNGREALAELRQRGLAIPVILTSGFHEQEALSPEESGTVAAFLPKPFRRKELEAVLDRVLG